MSAHTRYNGQVIDKRKMATDNYSWKRKINLEKAMEAEGPENDWKMKTAVQNRARWTKAVSDLWFAGNNKAQQVSTVKQS